jgi:preprotein translocase subunit SecB
MNMEENNRKDIYRELINSIEIKKINLLELNMKRFWDQPNERLDVQVHPSFDLISFNRNTIETQAKISIKTILEESEEVFFSIDAVYQVIYEIEEEIENVNEEIIELFVNQNLPINIWPYIRELVSTNTTKMGLPPLVLGVLKKFI